MKKARSLPWKICQQIGKRGITETVETIETIKTIENEQKTMKNINPELLEKEHVVNVYDAIAKHWSGTRYKPWPKVEQFIKDQSQGTFFGDLGCGNGKNLMPCLERGYAVGMDISKNLVGVTKSISEKFEVSVSDLLRLPFRDDVFDCVLCIAVLHHLSTTERRLQAIAESVRVLRPGGKALFYAWALEQEATSLGAVANESGSCEKVGTAISGHKFVQQDVLVPWHLKQQNGAPTPQSTTVTHAQLNTEKNAIVFERYCHVYGKQEWEGLFLASDRVSLEKVYWDSGNWAAVVQKR